MTLLRRKKRIDQFLDEQPTLVDPPDARGNAAPPQDLITSILAVDFGNVHTRGILIDQVDGVYRLIGRAMTSTTAGFPLGDASVGMERVIWQIGVETQRTFFRSDGRLITPEQPDRSGVDLVVATASLGRLLRTVLLGLVPNMSAISGQRAAAGTYVDIVGTITLDDDRSAQDQMNAIVLARPDLIFLTGGTDGGAEAPVMELAQVARLASRLMPRGHRPIILYAGNETLIAQLEALFVEQIFLIAENVRPVLEIETLESAQAQLGAAFDSFSAGQIAGFERVGEISRSSILPAAQSLNLITDYMGRTTGDTLVVDVGSAVSTISAYTRGHVSTSIRTDIGLGHSAAATLKAASAQRIRAWLPFVAEDNEINTYALNKTLRPAAVPERVRSLYLEHALLRAGVRTLLETARPTWTPDTVYDDPNQPLPPFAQIIGAGAGLTETGQPGMAALLLLDALQPVGMFRLKLDPGGLIAGLGAIARVNPEAVVQVLDGASLDDIGTCAVVSGTPRANTPAVRVRITNANGVRETHTVMGGQLWVYPIPAGTSADVRIRVVRRGLDIGGKMRLHLRVEGGIGSGGSTGLIIDARGRPLPLALTARGLAAQIPLWYANVTGAALKPIPEDWLTGRVTGDGDAGDTEVKRVRSFITPPRLRGGLLGARGDESPSMDDLTEERTGNTQARRPTTRRGTAARQPDETPNLDDMFGTNTAQPEPPKGKKPTKGDDDLNDIRNLFP
ncbi:MAG: glutamate mutase L [Chloroflexota bacterium]|nr:glutamate mutase L [Chloroflexota bacterium]